MTEEEDRSITNTWIGQEFGWDKASETDWALVKNNLEAAERVLDNPKLFPKADFASVEKRAFELGLAWATRTA